MPNNQHAQFTQNVLPRRLQHGEGVTTLRSVGQDNPTPPPARTASPQPAPLPKERCSTPFTMDTEPPLPGKASSQHTIHTTFHLKPRVRAELERKAQEQHLSISATGAAIL